MIRRSTRRRGESLGRHALPESRNENVRAAATAAVPRVEEHTKSRWVVFLAYGLLAAATQALLSSLLLSPRNQ